jgi:hypothetical protein
MHCEHAGAGVSPELAKSTKQLASIINVAGPFTMEMLRYLGDASVGELSLNSLQPTVLKVELLKRLLSAIPAGINTLPSSPAAAARDVYSGAALMRICRRAFKENKIQLSRTAEAEALDPGAMRTITAVLMNHLELVPLQQWTDGMHKYV